MQNWGRWAGEGNVQGNTLYFSIEDNHTKTILSARIAPYMTF